MTEVLGIDDFGPQTLSRCKDRTIPVVDAVLQRYSDCDSDECLVDRRASLKLQLIYPFERFRRREWNFRLARDIRIELLEHLGGNSEPRVDDEIMSYRPLCLVQSPPQSRVNQNVRV